MPPLQFLLIGFKIENWKRCIAISTKLWDSIRLVAHVDLVQSQKSMVECLACIRKAGKTASIIYFDYIDMS